MNQSSLLRIQLTQASLRTTTFLERNVLTRAAAAYLLLLNLVFQPANSPTYQQIRKTNPSGLLSTWQNRKRYIYALSISLRLRHLPDWTTCLNPSLKCSMLTKNHTPTLWSAATFNCGDIDWKCDPPVVTNHSTPPLMNKLLDLINDHALTQHVTVSTRPASLKTLDLVLSSVSSLISDVNVQPVKPHRAPRPRRKVYLHHKADLEALRREMSTRSKEFFELCSSRDLESNWTFFKNTLLNAVDKHVPSKMSPTKVSLPWITKSLKRHMRKRDRLYKKAKRSGNNKCTPTWKNYRSQRNKVVQLLKSAHNSYLDNVIGESLQDNPKRFWSYVKLARTENIGVPTLRQGESLFISEKDKADALNKYF